MAIQRSIKIGGFFWIFFSLPLYPGNRAMTLVHTHPKVILEKGTVGEVPCTSNNIDVVAVFWNKGPTYSSSSTIVNLELNNDKARRSGPGYSIGSFNISSNYSLIMLDVKVELEDRYYCIIIERATGTPYRNHSDVTVFAVPEKPFPSISTCTELNMNGTQPQNCSIASPTALNVNCTVSGYYPDIYLEFRHESQKVAILEDAVWNCTDGTRARTITISAAPSDEAYVCSASNVPSTHHAEHFAFILVNRDSTTEAIDDVSTEVNYKQVPVPLIIKVALPVILVLLILFATCATYFFVTKRKRRKDHLPHGKNCMELEPFLSQANPLHYCTVHPEEHAVIFCEDCGSIPLCEDCYSPHRGHLVISARWDKSREDLQYPADRKHRMHGILKLHDGRLAVAYSAGGIDIFSLESNERTRIMEKMPIGQFSQLNNGHLIITNEDRQIDEYDLEGNFIKRIVHITERSSMLPINVTAGGDILRGHANNKEIALFDPNNGLLKAGPIKTILEPLHIFPRSNGDICTTSSKIGEKFAVHLVKSDGTNLPLVPGAKEKRHFFTCDKNEDIYIASVSDDQTMNFAKFSRDGNKIEDIVLGQNVQSKGNYIHWLYLAALSVDHIAIADREQVRFYHLRSSNGK